MDSRNLVFTGQTAFLASDHSKIVWCGEWVGREDVIHGNYEEAPYPPITDRETELAPLPEGLSYQWYGRIRKGVYRLDVINEKWEIVEKRLYTVSDGTYPSESHKFYTTIK